jgi:predicted ATPase
MISRLKVKNFGAVRKADITFGDLTVFTGQHNTGKTYLALLTCTLTKAVAWSFFTTVWNFVHNKNKFKNINTEFEFIFKKTIKNEFVSNFFIKKVDELINQKSRNCQIEFEYETARNRKLQVSLQIMKNNRIRLNNIVFSPEYTQEILKDIEFIKSSRFLEKEVGTFIDQFYQESFIFIPTERLAILSNFTPTIQLMAQDLKTMVTRLRPLKKTMKPVVLDFMTLLTVMLSFAVGKPKSVKDDMLNGEIKIDPKTLDIIYITTNGIKVPITQASSGIAQLAGIVLALAEMNYQFVVIEEPEMNIHPNHQLKVAEFLAKLSNKAKVLITTHSDYLITKLVHLYIKKKIPSLKLYFFNEDGIVENVEIGEFGEFSIKTFDEVISKLSGEALELVESLKEG